MEEHAEGPLTQFEIKRLIPFEIFGIDASFTNSSLFMVIAAVAVFLFVTLAMRGGSLVPGRLQALAEASYMLIASALRDNVGEEGKKYFPFVFSIVKGNVS